jgi:hypothetical protein
MYGNTPGNSVKLGANSYLLNCTVENGSISGDGSANLENTILDEETSDNYAPYLNDRSSDNGYRQPEYLRNHAPYYYQLRETSDQINAGEVQSTVDTWLGSQLKTYVHFDSDLDLLGNPRVIDESIDNGCFETWKVRQSQTLYANTTPGIYGGNNYPHVGSVVYIMEDANLVLSATVNGETGAVTSDFPEAKPVQPGYLLVKEGGSLYGQSGYVRTHYLAVDKTYTNKYNLVAMPFPEQHLTEEVGMKTYSGSDRSAFNYRRTNENSSCWESKETIGIPYEGWLMERASATENTMRITGWVDSQTNYAYSEGGPSKTVVLNQYDSRDLDVEYPRFTDEYNMGWNLKGMPYLVNQYRTDIYDDTDKTYNMNVPHLLYTMNADGDGYNEKRSWDEGVILGLGEGYFTQTAIIGDSEDLIFKVPMFNVSTGSRSVIDDLEMPIAVQSAPSVQKVVSRNGRIPLRGFEKDDHIRIYNPSGALIFTGPASDSVNIYLPNGVYIIRKE